MEDGQLYRDIRLPAVRRGAPGQETLDSRLSSRCTTNGPRARRVQGLLLASSCLCDRLACIGFSTCQAPLGLWLVSPSAAPDRPPGQQPTEPTFNSDGDTNGCSGLAGPWEAETYDL